MKAENSAEFLTWESHLPTSGIRMETKCFDNWYVEELMEDTIGRRGIPGLWTFGSPYSRGIFLLSCVTVHTGVVGWHLPFKGRKVEHSSASLGLVWVSEVVKAQDWAETSTSSCDFRLVKFPDHYKKKTVVLYNFGTAREQPEPAGL